MSTGKPRLGQVDGLRTIAVAMVVCFHYLDRWTTPTFALNIYPYGSTYAHHFLTYGAYGVQLFFIISGFVIFLTLERCTSLIEFFVRRIVRLWPALILATFATILIARSLAGSPPHASDTNSLLPSLTLIPKYVWGLLGVHTSGYADGVLWSLWIEIQFYLVAGIIFFVARRYFLYVMTAIAVALSALTYVVLDHLGRGLGLHLSPRVAFHLREFLIGSNMEAHLWWFIFGMAMYQLWAGRSRTSNLVIAGIAIIFQELTSLHLAPWGPGKGPIFALVIVGIFALFAGGLYLPALGRVLSLRWMRKIGEASYLMYLIHEVIGLTLVIWITRKLHWSGPTSIIAAIGVLVVLLGVCRLSFRYFETPSQRALMSAYRRFARATTPQRSLTKSPPEGSRSTP